MVNSSSPKSMVQKVIMGLGFKAEVVEALIYGF